MVKRAEDRLKPGRKELYERPVSISLYLPAPLLERIGRAPVPQRSRNARLVALLELALEKLESGTLGHDADAET